MKILGIETSTNLCGVALFDESTGVLAEYSLIGKNIHAERLVQSVDRILTDTGLVPGAIGAVAVSAGPGSFTGLRIGMSAAKAFAFARGIPIVGVPTLRAMAVRTFEDSLLDRVVVIPSIDARRDEVYLAIFDFKRTASVVEEKELWSVHVVTLAEFRVLIDNLAISEEIRSVILTGDGSSKLMSTIEGFATPISARMAPAESRKPTAAGIARLGSEILKQHGPSDLEALEPLYMKEFVPGRPRAMNEIHQGGKA